MNEVTNKILTKEDKKEDRILVVKLDITDETSIRQAIKATLDKWKTIHVLLNVPSIHEHAGKMGLTEEQLRGFCTSKSCIKRLGEA
jgi:NADP-dependent 3-hydroxy acid dehydrogenase YdfG